jgi:hypothetical protein
MMGEAVRELVDIVGTSAGTSASATASMMNKARVNPEVNIV